MPLYDWTRVTPNRFHDMHMNWMGAVRTRLNTGLLPEGYFALAEQKAGPFVPDVLNLDDQDDDSTAGWLAEGGGAATATEVRAEVTLSGARHRPYPPARRVVVRHVDG